MEDQEAIDQEIARGEQVLQSMREEGIPTEEATPDDYFGFEESHRVMLPDGKSWVEHQTMNEGMRRNFLAKQNRKVTVQKATGNAIMDVQTGDERVALLSSVIVNWNLMRRDRNGELQPVMFNKQNLTEFLDKAKPGLLDVIEKDVRKANPWLFGEATVEDIKSQIKELEEMLELKEKEAAGKVA